MKSLTDALFDQGEVLRLIGVGVSGIDHGEYQQMGMDAWLRANTEKAGRDGKEDTDAVWRKSCNGWREAGAARMNGLP